MTIKSNAKKEQLGSFGQLRAIYFALNPGVNCDWKPLWSDYSIYNRVNAKQLNKDYANHRTNNVWLSNNVSSNTYNLYTFTHGMAALTQKPMQYYIFIYHSKDSVHFH